VYPVNPKYLRFHGNTWHFKLRIPKKLLQLAIFEGKQTYVKSLQTDSLKEALNLRDKELARFDGYSRLVMQGKHKEVSQLAKHSARYSMLGGGEQLTVNNQIIEPSRAIGEAFDKTVKVKRGAIRERELSRYKSTLDIFLSFLGQGDIGLELLKRKMVSEFIEHLKTSGLTDKTVLTHLGRLSVIYQTALAYEMVNGDNPFKGHGLSSKVTNKRSFYYPEQVKAIYDELPADSKLAWKVCFFTGLRAGELFALDKTNIVEVEAATKKVLCFEVAKHGGKTENAKRLVPIHEALRVDLEGFNGFPISQSTFEKRRRRAVVAKYGEAFADSHDTHSLRHTFVTTLVDALGNAELVEWLVGHSRSHRGVTYQNYFHGYGLDKLDSSVQSLKDIF